MSKIVSREVTINGNSYLVNFPNVGQFIDIKVQEQKLSKGFSKELVLGLGEDVDAYLYITAYAHVKVMIPDLCKDLKVGDLLDLSLEDFESITNVYLEQIKPWLDSVKNEIRKKTLREDGKSK